jgi:hypothetical protein
MDDCTLQKVFPDMRKLNNNLLEKSLLIAHNFNVGEQKRNSCLQKKVNKTSMMTSFPGAPFIFLLLSLLDTCAFARVLHKNTLTPFTTRNPKIPPSDRTPFSDFALNEW